MKKFISLALAFMLFFTLVPEAFLAESHKETDEENADSITDTSEDPGIEGESADINHAEETEGSAEPEETIESTEAEKESLKAEIEDPENKNTEESKKEKAETATEENVQKESETKDPEKQYNEFGIEIGTMVHGEDISKLSEEELQYIPEGWRDGVIEDEHHEEPQKESMMRSTLQGYPNVNNYINSNKLSAARVEYDHKSFFTRFNYRYGFGKVEGVVAHETANSNSTITGEIAFMSGNHKNAFVHAFVDHNRIIEIHPPELGAWGGGGYANQRFVHVELVRVHSFDAFARSINNYSDYLASLLVKFNLELIDADKHREGTLWSHRAVSNYLGGTTHVDPHGYFASWGYNWNDFVALVTKKYNALTSYKENSVSKLGHIRNANVEIYQNIKRQYSFNKAGSKFTNAVYYIKKEAIYNGNKYYLLSKNPSSTSGVVGWAKAEDIDSRTHQSADKKAKSFYIRGAGSTYSKAWGGSQDLIHKNLSSLKDQVIKVNLTESVGDVTWYRGVLNGKTVWIDSKYVSVAKETPVSKLGHIRNTKVEIYPELGASPITAGTTHTHAVYYIKSEAIYNGSKYYLLSKNPSSTSGVVGWAKERDIDARPHQGGDKKAKTFYINGTGSAYSKAWGGSKDLVHGNLKSFKNHVFKVNLTESVGNNTWYRGNLNGTTVWIHSSYLFTSEETKTSMLGHIRSGNVKIYPELGNTLTAFNADSTHTNAVYYIKKTASLNDEDYYLLGKNPSTSKDILGWAKVEDIDARPHLGVDKKAKTFYLKGTGSVYAKAWGGSKDLVYSNLAAYKNQEFKVNLTESVGNNVWYRGDLNGKTVWIHSSYISALEESETSMLGHIRSKNVKIYPKLGNESAAVAAGDTYTHAVYYIKKEAELNGQKYYLLSKNPSSVTGIVGWAKAGDMSTHSHYGVDKKAKTFYLKGTGSAYSKAWGGAKDYIYQDLNPYKGKEFKVHLTESVGSSTWYRGVLNGQTMWIHSSYLE